MRCDLIDRVLSFIEFRCRHPRGLEFKFIDVDFFALMNFGPLIEVLGRVVVIKRGVQFHVYFLQQVGLHPLGQSSSTVVIKGGRLFVVDEFFPTLLSELDHFFVVLALTNVFLDAGGGGSLPKFFQGGEFGGGWHVGIGCDRSIGSWVMLGMLGWIRSLEIEWQGLLCVLMWH